MGGVLEAAVAAARRSAEWRESREPASALERRVSGVSPREGGSFRAALAATGVRVIAECKRRSPSRGVLARDYNPAEIAASYAAAGAAAISVLTEPTFYDGSLGHLADVRSAVSIPVLRKDFIVTEYQILEARAAGADAVLLIVAALDDRTLARLINEARRLGLAALVEAHDADEVRRAANAGADVVGVNGRNLRTLSVSTDVFEHVASALPKHAIAVAESGIDRPDDVVRLKAMGYHACLVGERFMKTQNPGHALREFLSLAAEVRS